MLKIAIIQFKPVLGNIASNTLQVNEHMSSLTDARLVVLPELASTGYDFSGIDEARSLSEHPEASDYIEMLHSHAVRNDQYIVTGFNERSGDDLYNSSILIGPAGILGIYRKMHLFMNEKDLFSPGDGVLEVFDIGGCKIGMQICFDYLFPEPWRILAQQGADVIIHPSNLLTQNAHKAMPALSLMNRVFIVTANRIGTEGDLTFNGKSMIHSPSGDVLAMASEKSEEVLRLEIDPSLALDKLITKRNHVFNDRRPEHYRV